MRRFLLAMLLLPAAAAAWGPVGHEAVGAVADRMLSPAARAAVSELLGDDLDRDGRPSGRRNLAEIADWADEIRGTPADHPHWHYDNRPVCDGAPPFDCSQGDCASAAIGAQLALLADTARPRREREEALKWLVHLAGDLHQPLHAAEFAQGANLVHVLPHTSSGRGPQREESLHAFWDFHLVTLALHASRGPLPARTLDRLLRKAQAADPALVAQAPAVWADESNAIARDFALRIDGVGCELESAHSFPAVALSDAYVAQGRRIVEERLALAGARLAALLNRALAAPAH